MIAFLVAGIQGKHYNKHCAKRIFVKNEPIQAKRFIFTGGEDLAVKNDFSQGSIMKSVLSMAVPTVVAQCVQLLYNMVDRIYLGRLPGPLALTGLGLCLPIISIVMGFANLCGTGGAPLCSIHRGKGEPEEAERIMGNSFTLLLLFGAAMTVIVLLFRRPILYLFGASDATLP